MGGSIKGHRGGISPEYIAVKSGLVLEEHLAYLMAWKNIVNPDSKPLSLIYGCIGPDIATPLLATNVTSG